MAKTSAACIRFIDDPFMGIDRLSVAFEQIPELSEALAAFLLPLAISPLPEKERVAFRHSRAWHIVDYQ
ncbi:MAG: hypothetical protein QM627_04725 [Luteolibacter sp.]